MCFSVAALAHLLAAVDCDSGCMIAVLQCLWRSNLPALSMTILS